MELLTITEAAAAVGVSDRTIRKYTRAGKITAQIGPDGRPRYQRQEVEELRAVHAWGPQGSEGIGTPGRNDAEQVGSPGRKGSEAFRTDRKGSEAGNDTHWCQNLAPEVQALRAQLAAVEHERDAQEDYIAHLQAQLDLRAREIERHAVAEEQLRVMLMKLEATNAELAGALVQKALPAAEVSTEKPRRARWWAIWSRS